MAKKPTKTKPRTKTVHAKPRTASTKAAGLPQKRRASRPTTGAKKAPAKSSRSAANRRRTTPKRRSAA